MPMRGERARVAAEQIERRIDVGRALHVDPDEVVALGRAIDEPLQVAEAELLVEIEPELRRLHRDLRVETGGLHLIEHVEIMLRDLFGFVDRVRFSPSFVKIVPMPCALLLRRRAPSRLPAARPA